MMKVMVMMSMVMVVVVTFLMIRMIVGGFSYGVDEVDRQCCPTFIFIFTNIYHFENHYRMIVFGARALLNGLY